MERIENIKETRTKKIYRDLSNPNTLIKEYFTDKKEYIRHMTLEKLERIREKQIAILKDNNWPSFFIKPEKVSPIENESFYVEYPFLEGQTLYNYLVGNTISITTCANFISSLEKKVLSKEGYIFPDIANYGNIIILPSEEPMQEYCCIDPDSVLFGKYHTIRESSTYIGGDFILCAKEAIGLKKCIDDHPNKQLDIRSMYALLYMMMNLKESFYPQFYTKSLFDYYDFLEELNIPIDSSLYEKTMITLSNREENIPIGDSLYELRDLGYEFERKIGEDICRLKGPK